jgi:hypothetical protein
MTNDTTKPTERVDDTTKPTERVDAVDWAGVRAELDELGVGRIGPLLSATECRDMSGLYDHDAHFRSTVDMARHRYGEGQYRYLRYPLPDLIAELRSAFWPHLLPIAREWAERRGRPAPWPDDFDTWLDTCHAAGQVRPTPLILRYDEGGWNALHRDLYGELVFPLQVVVGLDRPGVDYEGGEFVVVEQRPRSQSRATAITIPQGHAFVFTTRDRPLRSARGWSAAPMRHGASLVRTGRRHTLGLIFHDAT